MLSARRVPATAKVIRLNRKLGPQRVLTHIIFSRGTYYVLRRVAKGWLLMNSYGRSILLSVLPVCVVTAHLNDIRVTRSTCSTAGKGQTRLVVIEHEAQIMIMSKRRAKLGHVPQLHINPIINEGVTYSPCSGL